MLRRPSSGARPVVRLAAAAELGDVSGRYFKRFRETAPSPAAQNDADARKLWEVSEKAVG